MFDENSLIHAEFNIEPKYFDVFLNNYFDENGKCLINGVSLSKQEATNEIKEIEEHNEKVDKEDQEKIERYRNNYIEVAIKYGRTKAEAESDLKENPTILNVATALSMHRTLFVSMCLETLKCSDEFIKYFISNTSYMFDEKNQLGVDEIKLDEFHYKLDAGISVDLKVGNPFYTPEQIAQREENDKAKREQLINGFLNYKRKFENIDNGSLDNIGINSQLSTGRHI